MTTMFKALDHKVIARIQEGSLGEAGTETTIVRITAVTTKVRDGNLVVTTLADMEDSQIKTLSHDQWVGIATMITGLILDKMVNPPTLKPGLALISIVSRLYSSHVAHYHMGNHLFCRHPLLDMKLCVNCVINRDMLHVFVLNVGIMHIQQKLQMPTPTRIQVGV